MTLPEIDGMLSADLTKPTMAFARGCSDPLSEAPKTAKSLQRLILGLIMAMKDTVGFPWVMVPVLSKTTVVVLWAFSKGSAPKDGG